MFRYLLGHGRVRGCRRTQQRDVAQRPVSVFETVSARALALVVLLAAAPATWALGLGDIQLHSALNEKLNANIQLLDADGLQPTEIIVSLASPEDFDRVGVERFFFLTDLHFEVTYDKQGVHGIKVTSSQPVTEPYLNFLVEVLWPNGRLLKEYTVLLDPPTYSPTPVPSVAAPAQSRAGDASAGRVERPTSAAASRGTHVQLAPGGAGQPSPLDEGVVDGEYRMTDRSDTLWSIASRTRPSGAVSIQQTMLAIQRLNPKAFIHDNINLLKAGYSLRLPTEQQALSIAGADANHQVAVQNEDWRAFKRGEPVPSSSPQQVAEAAPGAAPPAQAKPALQAQVDATPAKPDAKPAESAGDDGELRIVAGAGDSATGSAASGQLDTALEEQDRLNREVQSLHEQIDREKDIAANQIAVKDRQLEVKDQQIAEMQAKLADLRDQMQQAQAAGPQKQNQSASDSQAWWKSTYVLMGAVGVVVLLLVYALMAARRRRDDDEAFYDEVSTGESTDEAASATLAVGQAEALGEDEAEPEPAAVASAGSDDDDETASSETSDVIGEADIYIAYGRYPQAIGLLLGVLEEDPNRNDVRLKLLELYAETRDREAFDTHMAELVERCDDEEALLTARELGAEFGEDGAAAAATGGDGGPAKKAAEQQGEADAIDLDALMAPEEETGNGEVELDAAASPGADAPLGAEDFELELDDLVEGEAGAEADRPGDALGGDLGLDFDPDAQRNGVPGEAGADAEPEHVDIPQVTTTADEAQPVGELESVDDLDLDLDDAEGLSDDAFDFADEGDTASTKLDLARAYIDMGDQDGARDILNEVMAEGSPEQKQRASAMLEEL